MTEPLDLPAFLKVFEDGKQHRVTEAVFEHFLNVLPPVCMPGPDWQGRTWSFGFAEGYDRVIAFRREDGQYLAQQTPYLNPYEAGSIRSQKQRWVFDWTKVARNHPDVRTDAPEFGVTSFTECRTDADLIRRLANPDQPAGTALYVGDIATIKLRGDEWLTFKGEQQIGVIPWCQIIAEREPDVAQDYIDGVRAAKPQDIEQARGR